MYSISFERNLILCEPLCVHCFAIGSFESPRPLAHIFSNTPDNMHMSLAPAHAHTHGCQTMQRRHNRKTGHGVGALDPQRSFMPYIKACNLQLSAHILRPQYKTLRTFPDISAIECNKYFIFLWFFCVHYPTTVIEAVIKHFPKVFKFVKAPA